MPRWILWLAAGFAIASATAGDARPQSLIPSLVALSVANVDAAITWYRDNLGFTLKDRRDFPEHALRIAFLERDGFELELVENKKSVSLAVIQRHVPEADDASKLQGIVKLAFTVDDVAELAARLEARGVKFQMKLADSNRKPGTKSFIVRDADGNWIQLYGSAK